MQRNRVHLAQGLQQSRSRAAVDHVVLGVHLEPQARVPRCQRSLQVQRLEAEPGGEMGHGLAPAMLVAVLAQAFRGVSEPLPLGVLIAKQVPAGTFFQAFPW